MAIIQCPDAAFENIQAIIFDKDGTLANSQDFLRVLAQTRSRLIDAQVPGVQDPLLMAFGVEGHRLNPQGLMAVGTRYENEIAAAAYVAETGRDWAEALKTVQKAFREADGSSQRKAQLTPPYPGTQTLLEDLFKQGIKVGIFSSDTTANVTDFLQCYGLLDYIDYAQGTDEPSLAKPNPKLLIQTCQVLGVVPAATLVVGDSALDLQVARRADTAGFIFANWSGLPRLAGSDAMIREWSDLGVNTNSLADGIIKA